MSDKEYVKGKYPKAEAFPMIDNERGRTSYVIFKGGDFALEIFPNEGASTASKAWTNAKKYLQLNEK